MDAKPKIICFGEILWDVFPDGRRIGGAPLNAAYHLHQLETAVRIISRVGKDDLGDRLRRQIKEWGLPEDTIQQDSGHETSRVLANVQESGETTYEIVKPVAWDFIEWREAYDPLIKAADAIVFGSLAFRSPTSKETLFRILETANFVVYDVNLRPPHFTQRSVLKALEKTDLLKLNHDELKIIVRWLDYEGKPEKEQVQFLRERFSITEVLVTKGSKGAAYFSDKKEIEIGAFPVEVRNTVGSGDAFLAAFLSGRFKDSFSPHKQLEKAALLGAFVAGKDGACPDYTEEELEKFNPTWHSTP